jgi:heme/copper-type cytochrome/quinol oxidase subunit 3
MTKIASNIFLVLAFMIIFAGSIQGASSLDNKAFGACFIVAATMLLLSAALRFGFTRHNTRDRNDKDTHTLHNRKG